MRLWIAFFLALPLFSDTLPLTVTGATATQIVISYTAPTADACEIGAINTDSGVPAYDLDPLKWANADLDLSRTQENGFRWPVLASGLNRTVVLGGHDEVKQALDSKWYSTAYAANSSYAITVTCDSGADTGFVVAHTVNPPVGSTYPELIIPDQTAPIPGKPTPTIDYTDRTAPYVDPSTGILIRRLSSPRDNQRSGGVQRGKFLFAYDSTGTAWTGPVNALADQQPGSLASTSTTNSPLFLAWGNTDGGIQTTMDAQVILYGQGSAGTEVAEVCISHDSGQTCASKSLDRTFTTTMGVQASLPSNFPQGGYAGWAPWSTPFGNYDQANFSYTGVSASGSTVTMAKLSGAGFNTDRARGSKFRLSNCSVGVDTVLTVLVVNSPTSITTLEGSLNYANCAYQDYAVGARILLKNAGTLRLSAIYRTEQGSSAYAGSNGGRDIGNPTKITNIVKDCDGNVHDPPISGQFVMPNGGGSIPLIYLVQDNGRACLQGIGMSNIGYLYAVDNPWIAGDPTSFIVQDYLFNFYTATFNNRTDFTEYVPPAMQEGSGSDHFTYTKVTPNPSLAAQLASFGGPAAAAYATGVWGPFQLSGIIGGNLIWTAQPGGQNTPCLKLYTDGTGKLQTAATSFSTYPMRWGGCHIGPFGAGNHSELLVNPIAQFNNNNLFGGPYAMTVAAIRRNGVFQPYTLAVASGTAGNPTTLTIPAHDLDPTANPSVGVQMTCAGAVGTWAAVNGTFSATVINNNSVTIPVSTSGTYPGGVSCTVAPPIISANVGTVTGTTTACVTINATAGYTRYAPSGRSKFQDGDPLVFSKLSQNVQFYAKASEAGCNGPQQFGVYMDSNLTSPAAPSTVASAAGGVVSFAEQCPAQSSFPLPVYFDSGFGDGTLVRCVTVQVSSEPTSWFATAAEHAAYPAPGDLSNPAKSSLANLAVGDTILDQHSLGDPIHHERFLVLSKTKISETNIQLTLMRWYGNDPAFGADTHISNPYCCVHGPGWSSMAFTVVPPSWIDMTDPSAAWTVSSPIYEQDHHDVGPSLGGNVNLATVPYNDGVPDDIPNTPFSGLVSATPTYLHNSQPFWAGDSNDTAASLLKQAYPNHRQGTAPASEQNWKADVLAINPDNGDSQGSVDSTGIMRTLARQPGTNYVYKISNPAPSGVTNAKQVVYLMLSNGHQVFQDMSSPLTGNQITDASVGNFCIAYRANECRSGSAAGDIFFAATSFYDPGQCYANNQTLAVPCLFPLWAGAGWYVQMRQVPVDTNATGARFMTRGFALPLEHFSFSNWTSTPDGRWGVAAFNPIQQNPNERGANVDWYYFAIPPWPAGDHVDRTTFVSYSPSPATSGAGAYMRARFGYMENEPAGSTSIHFYGTTRLESTNTCIPLARAGDPFAYDSEPATCTSIPGTLKIPAIPGRILYYAIDTLDSSGNVVSSGPVQVSVVQAARSQQPVGVGRGR